MTMLSLWHGEITPRPGNSALLREITAAVAALHGVGVKAILSRERRYKVAFARQVAMTTAYDTGRFSNHRIGQFFDRDHTSVVHARKMTAARALAAQVRR